MSHQFPNEFKFGSATSAYQVEGYNKNDWSEWEKSEERLNYLERSSLAYEHGLENFICGKACDHYNRYKEDFKLAKQLGHKAARISVEPSRIEPQPSEWDESELKHYQRVLKTLNRYELDPFVTCWHFTNPLWFSAEGGFKSRESPELFSDYIEKVVSSLDEVNYWLTINEPMIYSGMAYLAGIWPPQEKNPFSYLTVLKNLARAHKKAYKAIKEIKPQAEVGIAKNNVWFEAASLWGKLSKELADYWQNHWFLDLIRDELDFIGLNYYRHVQCSLPDPFASKNEGPFPGYPYENLFPIIGLKRDISRPVSDIGWEICPEGIYPLLRDLDSRYEKPIYITENGLADKQDEKRPGFIAETLKEVSKAIEEGIDVRGYLHWSLLDNFEWDKGFWPRFGLVEVDYESLERIPRSSAYLYKNICKEKEISGNFDKI